MTDDTPRPWLGAYPPGVPADVDLSRYTSLVDLLEQAFTRHAASVAYAYMGRNITFAQVDAQSRAFAAWLQSQGLQKGERVALMMPNIAQYPVAVAGVLRAGLVVVNVNPLYTPRELEHQLRDSGAKAIVVLENFAHTLAQCIERTPVQHTLLCAMGDALGVLQGSLVNFVVRKVKKMVPPYALPGALRFADVLRQGAGLSLRAASVAGDDVAVLQYTGGTTGVSKGAVLLHRNIVANVLQSEAWNQPAMDKVPAGTQPVAVCALPLYHIYGFTILMMLFLHTGGKSILIPNPRDIAATLKELARQRFHVFPAINTLYNGLLNHPDFGTVDWSHLTVCIAGGMAMQGPVAKRWLEKTGCPVCEGYGLTETSPSVSCNPVTATEFTGTIGVPLPNTRVKLVDAQGRDIDGAAGEPGELAVKGPQVMAGYWQRPDESAAAFTEDGYFRTGDMAVMDARGYFKIVDRKKDMILVSGFNVYPNEIEDVVVGCPGVLECAAIGVPDEKSGEAVKLFVVRKDASLTEQAVRDFCQANLTGYKRPRSIEFRSDLPKTTVGKILRRELRDA